jgi:hypothetical protein
MRRIREVACTVLVLVALSVTAAGAASVPKCTLTQLSVTSKGPFGAGGTDGGILLFRNISAHACSLTGYPHVVAVGKTKGSTITASHRTSGMLGGWDSSRLTPQAPKPPTVILANRSEVASDWYQYVEFGPAGYTIFKASTLSIGLSGSTSAVHVSGSVYAANGKMWITPFVPGKTGNAEPSTTTSSQG